jgi:hypothetical protein
MRLRSKWTQKIFLKGPRHDALAKSVLLILASEVECTLEVDQFMICHWDSNWR